MPIASDRINRLAAINGAQRYLEIGVAEGYTFMDVKIAHKTGIDPNFLFDYTKYSDLPGHHMGHHLYRRPAYIRTGHAGLHQFPEIRA